MHIPRLHKLNLNHGGKHCAVMFEYVFTYLVQELRVRVGLQLVIYITKSTITIPSDIGFDVEGKEALE